MCKSDANDNYHVYANFFSSTSTWSWLNNTILQRHDYQICWKEDGNGVSKKWQWRLVNWVRRKMVNDTLTTKPMMVLEQNATIKRIVTRTLEDGTRQSNSVLNNLFAMVRIGISLLFISSTVHMDWRKCTGYNHN